MKDKSKENDGNEDFEIDITPSVTTYELYQNQSYTHWFSIGEFIDNSITSALRNKEELKKKYGENYRLEVNIDFLGESSQIRISDNAAGIEKEEIKRALTAGEAPSDKRFLSVHGVGMKMSAFWLGRNLTINTWPVNGTNGFTAEVDLDQIKITKSAKTQVHVINPRKQSGTEIWISKISQEKWPVGRSLGKLKMLLTSMYRIYLTDPDFPVTINFQGKPLEFADLKCLEAPFWPNTQGPDKNEEPRVWSRPYSFVTTNGHKITGSVGLLERMSRELSGFFLHYKGKGVSGIGAGESKDVDFSTAELKDSREYYRPFNIFGQEGSYRYQRFTGEFDISAMGKTSSTDSIKWDSLNEEQEWLEDLEKFLKDPSFNMWAMAENFQIRKARRILENPDSNSSEFLLSEVKEISTKFLATLHPELIDHGTAETVEDIQLSPIIAAKADDFVEAGFTWSVQDSSNHTHIITPEFIEDPRMDLYAIVSVDSDHHKLRINLGHPFIRKFQWLNPDVRLAVITLIYLMAAPEILLPLNCHPNSFRRKVSQIINSSLVEKNEQ
ncbi:Histidine kinase-, DNA gyrase B-, and HSP90-like ATPase [Candidatus Nanopelagicaceae bacterium]